jgi:hypothetical protein
MKVATVDILIEKAHFEPRVAVAVAAAMDEAIDGRNRDAQWVTVPILDARFTTLETRIDARFTAFEARIDARFTGFKVEIKGEILTHLYGAILAQFAVFLALAYFFVSHLR